MLPPVQRVLEQGAEGSQQQAPVDPLPSAGPQPLLHGQVQVLRVGGCTCVHSVFGDTKRHPVTELTETRVHPDVQLNSDSRAKAEDEQAAGARCRQTSRLGPRLPQLTSLLHLAGVSKAQGPPNLPNPQVVNY